MTISVLVADDQAMVRAGFAAILQAQEGIEVLGQAADGAEAVELARRLRPDVVLMDVRMPVMNGIDATRELVRPSRGDPHRPLVLVLTTFDADEYVYDALSAGASGFLLKDAPPADLVQAVRVVADGDALLAPRVTKRLLERFGSLRPAGGAQAQRLAGLTEREREILVLIGRGLSNAEIAAELFIAEQTVKTHVSRVFSKLGLRDRVQAVILAFDAGLVAPNP
ncbi:DNA-binding response regulator [Leifsonia sp. LS1]|uniref:response regulator n=1 Tax=unclassified Leifsonia TaxID=2663824 RepID=UPI001CBF5211|nr:MULTISPECIES: response regulator transcription factor [unclassified Leifsonia]UAJ77897.1 response regulator transcription factor [Leifsonia sp. ZF2019]GIT80362.1 DNA-binding response regulator [Leifsonia sp. LS1]